jgi:APA family basic amino acid/polyamine antiporter
MSGEIDRPARNVPRALLIGTLIVATLYLGLNVVFLTAAPLSALAGKAEVGAVAAEAMFGAEGGRVVSTVIALALVSSVSSMVMAGPRVTAVMGEDLPAFGVLTKRAVGGAPLRALAVQWLLALFFVFTATFEDVLKYIGFTLGIFTFLAVLGVFILRARPSLAESAEGRIRTWGYPVVPALFLGLSAWMVVAVVWGKPEVALAGLGTISLGVAGYFLVRRRR